MSKETLGENLSFVKNIKAQSNIITVQSHKQQMCVEFPDLYTPTQFYDIVSSIYLVMVYDIP